VFTDGAPEEEGLGENFERQRLLELEKSLSEAGLTKRSLVYIGFDDLNFIFDLGLEGLDQVIHEFSGYLEREKPDKIYIHAYEHGHIDHDAISYIAQKAVEDVDFDVELYEFSNYNRFGYGIPIPSEFNVIDESRYPLVDLDLTPTEEEIKKNMAGWFISQDQYGVCSTSLDWPNPRAECRESIIEYFYHPDWIRRYPGYDYTKSPCINDSCRHAQSVGGINWSIWYEFIEEYEREYSIGLH
jgi:LmbE family N-acetylglucosaminyl deacetylase